MAGNQSERLEQVLSEIRKRWGADAIGLLSTVREHPTWISTTSPDVDLLLGGGIPCGEITELVAVPTTGMTTLLFRSIANAQVQDRHVIYIDFGRQFDPVFAQHCGINLDRVLIVRPMDVEDALDVLLIAAGVGTGGLVILDSTHEIEKQPRGTSQLSLALARLSVLLQSSGSTAILVNLAGRRTRSAAISTRLCFARLSWVFDQNDVVGCQTRVTLLKRRKVNREQSIEACFSLIDTEQAVWKRAA